MANWLIYEGSLVRQNYTVISLDLPNSGYATRFQVLDVVDAPYDPKKLQVLNFELQYVRDFIDALDLKVGNVKGRIKAVMGGSLGGNMSLLLSTKQVPGLETIVAWSVTAVSTMFYLGLISVEWVATFLKHLQDGATDSELTGAPLQDHSKETEYMHHVYFEPLNPTPIPGVLPYMPPDPIMWFRGPDPVPDTPTVIHDWEQCKKDNIKASRFDRYEIYSEQVRHWTNAIDLEQISFSFHDDCAVYGLIASSPGAHLLLASGDRDNFDPNAIYNSTLELAHLIRHTAHGKAEFWFDTGHSLHSERPHLFAKDIVYFLTHLDAPDSPFGTVGAPQPAPFSATDQ
jgi:pimeloyl-ACP methyl ester carboxylesterase